MRIGYSFWGFLGDYKEDADGKTLSTPDGNAAYGTYLIDALYKAGHEVAFLQQDRDWPVFKKRGKYDFQAFSQDLRFRAYLQPIREEKGFPKIDVLLVEWRFPIPGRNTPDAKGSPGYQPDLERQHELLEYYRDKNTKIIVWDLDYKLTEDDERRYRIDAVLETAVTPRKGLVPRYRVEPPVYTKDLLARPPRPLDPHKKLVYVGSRYERDDIIEKWVKPVSDVFPDQVYFYGNWTAEYNFAEVKAKWPNVKYCDRISMKDFDKAYGDAVACPLLAKKSYLENGFITPRIWEAIIFGTIPVGLAEHNGIYEYLPADLVARDPEDMVRLVNLLSRMPKEERDQLIHAVVCRIEFMDASNFVRVIEGVCNGKGN
jgi:hypothetical protein